MFMKIFKYVVSIICISLIIFPGLSYADKTSNSTEVLFEKSEIKDQKELWNRAVNGISDIYDDNMISEAKLVDLKTNKVTKVKTYKTTQHLKTVKNTDGSLEKEYATTTISIVPLAIYQDDIRNGYYNESSGGVTVYNTAYFHIAEIDPLHLKTQHYRTKGSWQINDSSYVLTSKQVTMYTLGSDATTGNPVEQSRAYTESSSSYDHTPYPAMNWIVYDYINLNLDDCGTTIYTGITRGGSSWGFYVTNKILGPSNITLY